MDDKKVVVLAVLILLVGLISFNLGPKLTGNVASSRMSRIILDKTIVDEGGTITVTIIPGRGSSVVNDGIYSPVELDLYRVNELGYNERVGGQSLTVCGHNRCLDEVTKIYRIQSDLIKGFEPSQRFYLRGVDEATGEEIKAYFTVVNKDKIQIDKHK